MEALWKSEVFTADDLRVFRYRTDPIEAVVDSVPECTAFHTSTSLLSQQEPERWLPKVRKRKLNDWAGWLDIASSAVKTEDYFTLILPPIPPAHRPSRFLNIVNSAALKNLPISEEAFRLMIEKLSIHHALAVIVDRGVPTISRIQSEVKGKNCYVYTLRVEHTLKHQTAMTITHFPKSPPSPNKSTETLPSSQPSEIPNSATYALILGYQDADITSLRSCLEKCKESIFNPFTLIKAFLSVERGHRFTEVNCKIVQFQNILQNYGHLPLGAEAAGQVQDEGSEQDPKNLIGLYLDICTLKNRLMAWNMQIVGFKKFASDFISFTTGRPDIDPEEYLQRMVDEYDIKINKCDMVLQGASLAFQMETAHLARLDSARSIEIAQLSREDSERSIEIANLSREDSKRSLIVAELSRLDSRNALHDGKQMKAIALLTMIFLPGTFVATLLAVPMFDNMKRNTSFEPWAWYPILFLPLTAIVLVAYVLWIFYYKSKAQKNLDNYSV